MKKIFILTACFLLSLMPLAAAEIVRISDADIPSTSSDIKFVKIKNYFPGDTITLTNYDRNVSVEVIVLSAIEDNTDISLIISNETATALDFIQGASYSVKIANRPHTDKRVKGNASITCTSSIEELKQFVKNKESLSEEKFAKYNEVPETIENEAVEPIIANENDFADDVEDNFISSESTSVFDTESDPVIVSESTSVNDIENPSGNGTESATVIANENVPVMANENVPVNASENPPVIASECEAIFPLTAKDILADLDEVEVKDEEIEEIETPVEAEEEIAEEIPEDTTPESEAVTLEDDFYNDDDFDEVTEVNEPAEEIQSESETVIEEIEVAVEESEDEIEEEAFENESLPEIVEKKEEAPAVEPESDYSEITEVETLPEVAKEKGIESEKVFAEELEEIVEPVEEFAEVSEEKEEIPQLDEPEYYDAIVLPEVNIDLTVITSVPESEVVETPVKEPEIEVKQEVAVTESKNEVEKEISLPEVEVTVNVEKTEIREEVKVEPKVAEQPKTYSKYIKKSEDLKKEKYYIQIAAYKNDENINEIVTKYGKKYPLTLVELSENRGYKILVGPLTVDEYKVVLERFKSYGFKDAFVKKN